MRKVGIGLIIVSFVPWGLAFAVPFMRLPLSQKAATAVALFMWHKNNILDWGTDCRQGSSGSLPTVV
ncbi:transporter suffix domain-containing protein [Myxacorys almedinensis]|uniref:Transporter suffix domain-containing protein n=1 Tax=Myxacorys almedinensis A TaxID=2690445 RepID=A0A8J7Z1Q2_9CYAN|nr:transporter suffix domain-containing protein [Myxacorys almedinensis]NDJ17605.1 transporter suffix domain-containing protein [Myxacorys almedinensis A]